MINQVVVAGRVTEAPTLVGATASEFVLEVEHAPVQGDPEVCEVTVRIEAEKSASAARRWVEKGSWVTVDGHLRVDDDRWYVVGRRWDFLPRELDWRCLWVEDARSPEPAAAGVSF